MPFSEVFGEGLLRRFWWLFSNALKYTGIFIQMLFTGFQKPWSAFIRKSKKNDNAIWFGFFFYGILIYGILLFLINKFSAGGKKSGNRHTRSIRYLQ